MPVRDGLTATRARLPETAPETTAGEFVGHLIATQRHRHPRDDAAALRARFSDGQVVDRRGRPFSPASPLSPGEDVFFYRMPAPETPVPFDIDILYRDDDLLVADKPPFLATMPRGRHITETLTVRLRRSLDIPELVPAHRLDRVTSGVLLCTLRREVRGAYQTLFADRQVDKTYLALAPWREDLAFPLTVRNHIRKTRGQWQAQVVPGAPVNAVTQIDVEARDGDLAVYRLTPHTGRTHQLRLHLHDLGIPIVDDPLYPEVHEVSVDDFSRPLQLLASTVGFVDPVDGRERRFASERRLPLVAPG